MTNLNYKIIRKKSELSELVSYLYRNESFCTDLETTSLETHSDKIKIVGAGFSVKPREAFYIPFNDPTAEFSIEDIISAISVPLEDENLGKIGQNIKYDYRVYSRFGIKIKNIKMDTMVASYCLFCDKVSHKLDEMAMNHFGHIKIRTKSVIPAKKPKKRGEPKAESPTMLDSPVNMVGVYCMEDVDFTMRLYEYYSYLFTLPENEYARKLFNEIESKLTPILAEMECNGVSIDTRVLSELKEELISSINILKSQINDIAGKEITITNANQIGELVYNQLNLFDKRGIKVKKTKTGKLSTNEKTLKLIKDEPVVGNILQVKKLNKLMSTYVEPIPEAISKYDKMLHASFNQHVTSTGRLASSDPNLQNIPKREALGERIRGAFVSRFENGKIASFDYSQQELRIMAHLSQEPSLVTAYNNNKDVHITVASSIFGVAEDKVTKDQRNKTKTINYGLIYGMEAEKLSNELGITVEEAKALIEQYMSKMTHVSSWIKESRTYLSKHGFVSTLTGRRRYIPKVFSPIRFIRAEALREGPNAIVQGTAADQAKISMIGIDKYLKSLRSKMIMQVHDELVLDVHPSEESILPDITEIMRNAIVLSVPMEVDGRLGKSWKDAH